MYVQAFLVAERMFKDDGVDAIKSAFALPQGTTQQRDAFMRVNGDVMEVVEILNAEGFGFLAGELLAEVGQGRDVDGQDGATRRPWGVGADSAVFDDEVVREAIPDPEQLAFALKFLELRLVEPMRRLAEAEALADELAVEDEPNGKPRWTQKRATENSPEKTPGSMRIVFLPPTDRRGLRLDRSEAPGSSRAAELLSHMLGELSDAAV